MPVIVWDDKFSVGVAEFDEQHKRLIDMINQLVDAIQSYKEREVLEEILPELERYTAVHFKGEEEKMRAFGYPDLEEHIKEHQRFIEMLQDFRSRYAQKKITLSSEVLKFLADWLKGHIMGVDKAYGPHLNQNGVF